MDSEEFARYRKKLGKTQKQMAQLIGTSIKAVHSYEQGWRSVPAHVERQVLFLISRLPENRKLRKNCWTLMKCPAERRGTARPTSSKAAPSAGLSTAPSAPGRRRTKNWKSKMEMCRTCEVMKQIL